MAKLNAFKALTELAALSHENAQALPAQVDASPRWSGIGFSLLGCRFVASLKDISEMLEVPIYTKIPGVERWVVGLSNVRGRLLPLFDMAQFLGGKATPQRKQHRVLVVDQKGFYSGLIVDQAHGMQHFTSEVYSDDIADTVPDVLKPLAKGTYTDASGNPWVVFHVPTLLDEQGFASVAAA